MGAGIFFKKFESFILQVFNVFKVVEKIMQLLLLLFLSEIFRLDKNYFNSDPQH